MNYRALARGAKCYTCGVTDDTVVLAHYSGFRQYRFGKGRGTKCRDFFAAPQCAKCHADGPFAEGWVMPGWEDQPKEVRSILKSEEQLFQILLWHEDQQ